jgi:hypothetical protein
MSAAAATAQEMVVGIFDSHEQAERAVHKLIEAGVPAGHISIVAEHLQVREQPEGFITTGDMARDTAGIGAWTGGLFGLLAGAAFLWIPGLGPLIVLGPLAGAALGALEGGAVGGLLGAILGRQLEKDRVMKYEVALQGGKYLVTVHGSPQEIETARRVMGENQGQEVAAFPAPAQAA